jgi:hypothetical protein
VSADGKGTPEVHGKMDLSKHMLFQSVRLVGAVGIENTTERNFKELEGMLGNAKVLKRNNREGIGILIGPLMAPRFSQC